MADDNYSSSSSTDSDGDLVDSDHTGNRSSKLAVSVPRLRTRSCASRDDINVGARTKRSYCVYTDPGLDIYDVGCKRGLVASPRDIRLQTDDEHPNDNDVDDIHAQLRLAGLMIGGSIQVSRSPLVDAKVRRSNSFCAGRNAANASHAGPKRICAQLAQNALVLAAKPITAADELVEGVIAPYIREYRDRDHFVRSVRKFKEALRVAVRADLLEFIKKFYFNDIWDAATTAIAQKCLFHARADFDHTNRVAIDMLQVETCYLHRISFSSNGVEIPGDKLYFSFYTSRQQFSLAETMHVVRDPGYWNCFYISESRRRR